jgi:hypothetical protein
MFRDDTVPAPGKAREMHFITGAERENVEPKRVRLLLEREHAAGRMRTVLVRIALLRMARKDATGRNRRGKGETWHQPPAKE